MLGSVSRPRARHPVTSPWLMRSPRPASRRNTAGVFSDQVLREPRASAVLNIISVQRVESITRSHDVPAMEGDRISVQNPMDRGQRCSSFLSLFLLSLQECGPNLMEACGLAHR